MSYVIGAILGYFAVAHFGLWGLLGFLFFMAMVLDTCE